MATVTEMETQARVIADQDESTFPTSAQYREFISDAAQELWGRMIAAGLKPGQTATQVTATGAASYTLGTTPLVVLSVERHDGTERLPLQRAAEEDLPSWRSMTGSQAFAYDLVGGATGALGIELFPPTSTGTYTVRFIPRFVRFTSGADTWFGPARSDEFIVRSAAATALGKEGDRAGEKMQLDRADKVWGDIVQMASWQDAQYPGRVRDARPDIGRRYRPFDDYRVRRDD